MAQQTMVVRIEASPELEKMLRRVTESAIRAPALPEVQPITIQAPDGERMMFVDDIGEAHWVLGRYMQDAQARGWRQAFTLKER